MTFNKKIILLENKIDIKISKWSNNNFILKHNDFKKLALELFNPKSDSILMLRYLRINSFLGTISRYLFLILICKISKKKIYWIMHNYYEHKSKNILANKIIRNLILIHSDGIFIVHAEMKNFIKKKFHSKTSIIPFGPMNKELKKKYLEFDKNIICHNHYDVICLTTSDDYFLEEIYSIAKLNSNINFLIISPGSKSKILASLKNVSFITSFGFLDIFKYKNCFNKSVGFLPHKNFSFPTTLNFFSESLIPTISMQANFASHVINEYKLGMTINSFSDLPIMVLQIQKKYCYYVDNCRLYKSKLNWNIGANVLKNKL